jgi:FixJ family two-component response regulator
LPDLQIPLHPFDFLSKTFRDQELLDSIQLALDKGSHQARKGKSSDSNCARASKR